MFLVHHIDSLIQILVGISITWLAFRRPNRLGVRTAKLFRYLGPALIVIGGVLLAEPAARPVWQRKFTSDQVASAEFPGEPTRKELTDTAGTEAVKRTSLSYDVPGKDIALFLSYSAMPEAARAMTEAQRIATTLDYMAAQGSKVLSNEQDPGGPIHRMTLRQDTTTTQMALAYVGDNVYRVVATWSDGQEDLALTERFLRSFQVGSPQAPASR